MKVRMGVCLLVTLGVILFALASPGFARIKLVG